MKSYAVVVVFALLLAAIPAATAQMPENCPMHQQHQSSAVTVDSGGIGTLPAETVQALVAGTGMGMAKPAELNHFPGPRHVLDLADKLKLSPEQISRTRVIFDGMHTKAIALGQQILAREQELDRAFAGPEVDASKVQQLVTSIGQLQAQLRNVHLAAHLEERKVLDAAQVSKYDTLRGNAVGTAEHVHAH